MGGQQKRSEKFTETKKWSDPRALEETGIDGEVVGGKVERRSVTVNRHESPLGWLRSRGHIAERQYLAGERLRTDWERAQLSQRTTMAWDVAPVARADGAGELSEHRHPFPHLGPVDDRSASDLGRNG